MSKIKTILLASAGALALLGVGIGSISEAEAFSRSECVTAHGTVRGTVELLAHAEFERRRPCAGHESEVRTQTRGVIASERARARGLVPEGFESVEVEGSTLTNTHLVSFPDFPVEHEPSGTLVPPGIVVHIFLEDEEGIGGCAPFFIAGNSFTEEQPGLINLSGLDHELFGWIDRAGGLSQATDGHLLLLVDPVREEDARFNPGPVYIALPDGTEFRFYDIWVKWNSLGQEDCWTSVRVEVVPFS